MFCFKCCFGTLSDVLSCNLSENNRISMQESILFIFRQYFINGTPSIRTVYKKHEVMLAPISHLN